MSLDERLRDSLRRAASTPDIDVSASLHVVRTRTRRAVIRQRIARTGLIVVAILALVMLAPRVVSDRQWLRTRPAHPGVTVHVLPGQLQGRYTTIVPPGSAIVRDDRLAGVWTMSLGPNGVATMSAPPSYRGVLTGVAYQVSGTELRIDLFGQDLCTGEPPGTYQWRRSGNILVLGSLHDHCGARVDVLSTQVWTGSG